MIEAQEFLNRALSRNITFYTGVPCSFLEPLLAAVSNDRRSDYVAATSEGEAVGIAAGAWLAGKSTMVLCQNSGLGNTVNPITSLNAPFRIPTLLLTSWRGEPGLKDEPQHEVMGRITHQLLELMDVSYHAFPTNLRDMDASLDLALDYVNRSGKPFALVVRKGDFGDEIPRKLRAPRQASKAKDIEIESFADGEPCQRAEILNEFLSIIDPRTAVVATTGKCGRELFTLNDRPQHIYQVGSMGCASAMALGIALNSKVEVVVLDGDGAALMKLGNLATIAAEAPANFTHILLDNGVYDSTGQQPTVSNFVDFPSIAKYCGYNRVLSCSGRRGFEKAMANARQHRGPRFIHVRISPGSIKSLGRPTLAPSEIAQRFRQFMLSIKDTNGTSLSL